MGPLIFISYARADGDKFAKRIYDELKHHDFTPWLDLEGIKPGVDWDDEIDKALRQSRALVVILTPAATQTSVHVKSEWLEAINLMKPIFPLICEDTKIPRTLNVYNCIDLRNNLENGINLLIENLKNIDRNHLENLQNNLQALKKEQSFSNSPQRYEQKINTLESAIQSWKETSSTEKEDLSNVIDIDKLYQEKSDTEIRITGRQIMNVDHYFKNRDHELQKIREWYLDESKLLIKIIGRKGIGKTALASKFLSRIQENESGEEGIHDIDGIAYFSQRTTGLSFDDIFFKCIELLNTLDKYKMKDFWKENQDNLPEVIERLLEYFIHGNYLFYFDNFQDVLDQNGKLVNSDIQQFFNRIFTAKTGIKLLISSNIPFVQNPKYKPLSASLEIKKGLPFDHAIEYLYELDNDDSLGLQNTDEDELEKLVNAVHCIPKGLELIINRLNDDPWLTIEEVSDTFYKNRENIDALISNNFLNMPDHSRFIVMVLSVFNYPVQLEAIKFMVSQVETPMNIKQIVTKLIKSHIVVFDRKSKSINLPPLDRDIIYRYLVDNDSMEFDLEEYEYLAANYYNQHKNKLSDCRDIADIEPWIREVEHLTKAKRYNEATNLLLEFDLDILRPWGLNNKAIELHNMIDLSDIEKSLEIRKLNAQGVLYTHLAKYEDALHYSKLALEESRESNNLAQECESLLNIGDNYRHLGDLDKGIEYMESALDIAKKIEEIDIFSKVTFLLSIAYIYDNRPKNAIDQGKILLEKSQKHNSDKIKSQALNILTTANLELQQYAKSIEYGLQSLELFEKIQNFEHMGYIYNNLGLAYYGEEYLEKSKRNFELAIENGKDHNKTRVIALSSFNLGILYLLENKYEKAKEFIGKATENFTLMNVKETDITKNTHSAITMLETESIDGAIDKLNEVAEEIENNPDLFFAKSIREFIGELSEMNSG